MALLGLVRWRALAVFVSVLSLGALNAGPVSNARLVATAGPAGCDALCTRVRSELASFTAWLKTNNAKGLIGEVG